MPSWLWSNTLRLFASNVGGAACGLTARSCRRAASKRPLNRHTPPSFILVFTCAQKLSPSINVELVVGLEVFRQRADRIASHPPPARP
jgi:hypothetical protein